jgi:hypothetical protein
MNQDELETYAREICRHLSRRYNEYGRILPTFVYRYKDGHVGIGTLFELNEDTKGMVSWSLDSALMMGCEVVAFAAEASTLASLNSDDSLNEQDSVLAVLLTKTDRFYATASVDGVDADGKRHLGPWHFTANGVPRFGGDRPAGEDRR